MLLVHTLDNTPGVLPGFCHLVANLHFFSATNYSKRKVDLWRKGTIRLGISFDALTGIAGYCGSCAGFKLLKSLCDSAGVLERATGQSGLETCSDLKSQTLNS